MNHSATFESKFAPAIAASLSCHDRVIFKGYLPLWGDERLNLFVDHVLKIPRKDFLPKLEALSQQLVDHAKLLADKAGAPYEYMQGAFSKEEFIDRVDQIRRHPEGLLAVLCVQEVCATVKLLYGKGKPQLGFRRRPQRVLYFYYNYPDFGRIYIRLQTWFPYPVQIYVNGHEWLAQQMTRLRLGFVQLDNAFSELDCPQKAQQLADRFPNLDWPRILSQWIKPLMPLLKHEWFKGLSYDWTIAQCEYSTDLIFRSKRELSQLFPQLLNHALLHFSAQDVLRFLGRRWHRSFDGEVLTDCKMDREPGARIKFRMKGNWLKMYDKFGLILRVETVINDPKEFRILRWGTRKGNRVRDWYPMAKRVANFWRYSEIAQEANGRFLDALAQVHAPLEQRQALEQACQPVTDGARRRRGLNPVHAQDQALFRAVLHGAHLIKGFRNRDIAAILFKDATKDKAERRRRSARTGRQLRLLRAHKLIKKAPRATKYYLTAEGLGLMGAAICIKDDQIPSLMEKIKRLAS